MSPNPGLQPTETPCTDHVTCCCLQAEGSAAVSHALQASPAIKPSTIFLLPLYLDSRPFLCRSIFQFAVELCQPILSMFTRQA